MKGFKVAISIVILTASVILLFNRLFSPQPIQIILETGEEVVTQTSNYFSLSDVLFLLVLSFLIGSLTIYLFYSTDTRETLKKLNKERNKENKYDMIIPLLKGDEKRVFLEIINSKGEILQNKLVLKTGFTKVRVSRALSGLEKKKLILKERYGLTNKIKLKK